MPQTTAVTYDSIVPKLTLLLAKRAIKTVIIDGIINVPITDEKIDNNPEFKLPLRRLYNNTIKTVMIYPVYFFFILFKF